MYRLFDSLIIAMRHNKTKERNKFSKMLIASSQTGQSYHRTCLFFVGIQSIIPMYG